MSEQTEQELQQKWAEAVVKAARSVQFIPDIPDREKRDHFVLSVTRALFASEGEVTRTLVLRLPGNDGLVKIEHDIPYELAHMGPKLARGAAEFFKAQQLYLIMEMWWAQATKEELKTGDHVQPRHNPNRREGLMVISEDPYRLPPINSWVAQITRDKKSKGKAGPWTTEFNGIGGRLTYLLPPAAYLAAGAKVPEA